MSTCSASFSWFRYMELDVWAFETKNAKNAPWNRLLSLESQKHVGFFCLHFFEVLGMVAFCTQNEFSAVFCSLSTGRGMKPLFFYYSKIFFFPGRHGKYAFKATKDVSSKNLAYNVLRVDVASAVREVPQKSPRKVHVFAPVVLKGPLKGSINCGTTFLQICLPTAFGERALPLHILKLLGVLGKVHQVS